jgi:hypothetical protein
MARVLLPVLPQRQPNAVWCWATVGSMVSIFRAQVAPGTAALSSCQVASTTLGGPCCGLPPAMPCLRLLDFGRVLQSIGHFGGVSSNFNFAVPRTGVAQGLPVAAAVQLVGGPMHLVLVVGFEDASSTVDAIDPASGVSTSLAFTTLFANPRWTWRGWFLTR